jgi:hypothetical protein
MTRYFVINNVTGAKASRFYGTREEAARMCRVMNKDLADWAKGLPLSGPRAQYGIGIEEES